MKIISRSIWTILMTVAIFVTSLLVGSSVLIADTAGGVTTTMPPSVGGSNVLAAETNQIRILKLSEIANLTSIEWVWRVERDVLKRQPKWDGYSSEVPFPMHKAVVGAMQQIKKLHPEITKWKIDYIRVGHIETDVDAETNAWLRSVWFYQIQLIPADETVYDQWESKGQLATLSRVVLMDGTILSATIDKDPGN